MQVEERPVTLLQYFTPTPLAVGLAVACRTIRLESDSTAIVAQALRCFKPEYIPAGGQDFLWRLVGEGNAASTPAWPEACGFLDEDLCFLNFGQRACLAVDASALQAVGFLPEAWVGAERGFSNFLALLLCLTAPCLGFTPIGASCLTLGGRDVLIFDPPEKDGVTGSTSPSRPSPGPVTLLDCERDQLRAWSYFSERSGGPAPDQGVAPAASFFIEEHAGASEPIALHAEDFRRRLAESILFKNGGSAAVVRKLESLPSYRMAGETAAGVRAELRTVARNLFQL